MESTDPNCMKHKAFFRDYARLDLILRADEVDTNIGADFLKFLCNRNCRKKMAARSSGCKKN